MRITKDQIDAFTQVLTPYDFSGELRLYGSRVDDTARGGDIDLLLLTLTSDESDLLNKNKHKILVEIKNMIGDQKIDLLISNIDDAKGHPFIQTILPDSVLIYHWK